MILSVDTAGLCPEDLRQVAALLRRGYDDPAVCGRVADLLQRVAAGLVSPAPVVFALEPAAVRVGRKGLPLVEYGCGLAGAALVHRVLATPGGVSLEGQKPNAARNLRNTFAAWAETLPDVGRDLATAARRIEFSQGRARLRPGGTVCVACVG